MSHTTTAQNAGAPNLHGLHGRRGNNRTGKQNKRYVIYRPVRGGDQAEGHLQNQPHPEAEKYYDDMGRYRDCLAGRDSPLYRDPAI